MEQKLDILPGIANLEGIFVDNDISFLLFNSIFSGDDSLNTEEVTMNPASEDNGGKWSYGLSNPKQPLTKDFLGKTKDVCKATLLHNLKYFFPDLHLSMQLYRDACLNLRFFGLYYKKKKSKIECFNTSKKIFLFTDRIEDTTGHCHVAVLNYCNPQRNTAADRELKVYDHHHLSHSSCSGTWPAGVGRVCMVDPLGSV